MSETSNGKCLFKFKALTLFFYELEITFKGSNKLLIDVFKKSIGHLKRIKNVQVEGGKIEEIQEFDIPPKFLNLLTTFIGPQMKVIDKDLRVDNIEILTWKVKKSFFKRFDKDTWDIVIVLEGDYVDKRRT